MPVEENIALLRHAFTSMQDGDLKACEGFLTEDFIANLPGLPTPVRGREIWSEGARSMLDAFPDLQIKIEDIFGYEDRVAMRLSFHGTHEGTFLDVPPTRRRVSFTSVEIYRVADGLIAEEWVAPDMMGLLQQIS